MGQYPEGNIGERNRKPRLLTKVSLLQTPESKGITRQIV
jgi:hypothetical protein